MLSNRTLAAMGSIFMASLVAAPAPGAVYRITNPSPAADAAFGSAVAGLGDQNGDGVADFVVGVPGSDRADILSGKDRSLIRSLHDPQALPGMQFGFAVARIGDVNGDGVDDVAVGAPGPGLGQNLPLPCDPDPATDDCPRPDWGRVFLFSGANGALIRKIVPAVPDFLAFGVSLAPLGDVNGDGVPDLAVGAPVLLASKWGSIYAFSGANGAELWVFREPPFPARQALASLGVFVAPVNDLNGDGRNDLLAAAPFHDNSGTGLVLAGRVFVLSGANGALVRSHQPAPPIDNGFFGGKLGAIGDQNADGVGDYLIGHRGAGEILLFSGSGGGLIRTIPAPAATTDGLLAFARAGDRDGDAKEDFWVGLPAAGATFLLNGPGAVLLKESDPGVAPANPSEGFGTSLADLADVNGDGKSELVVGKPGDGVAGLTGAGSVFLITSNRPPIANAGTDRTIAAGASCLGPVTLDGSGSSDPDGDALTYKWSGPFGMAVGVSPAVSLPLGQHTITLLVDDGQGGTSSDTVTVTVLDQSAPTIVSLVTTPNVLWPANHKMQSVTLIPFATDNCDAAPVCRITAVASNEPENDLGDANTAPDFRITADLKLELRAERSGQGQGRVYTIELTCSDTAGNDSKGSSAVSVPKNGK